MIFRGMVEGETEKLVKVAIETTPPVDRPRIWPRLIVPKAMFKQRSESEFEIADEYISSYYNPRKYEKYLKNGWVKHGSLI